jgi:hypothetical protein
MRSSFQMGGRHESQFPNVAFLARQVLGIVESQIETEQNFNIAGIIITLRRSRLGSKNLEHLMMITKNWPNDAPKGCGRQRFFYDRFLDS